jgi:hypothetical protein
MIGGEKDQDSDAAADRMWFLLEISDRHLKLSMNCCREMRENTKIDLLSEKCYSGIFNTSGTRRRFCFSFRDFFRHSVRTPSWCLISLSYPLRLLVNDSLEFDVLTSSLRRTAASLSSSEEKLSISHVEMVHARLTIAWSVCTFCLTSPTMTHQLIEEGVENEDILGFCLPPILSLERWVETRVVGWANELIVAV